MWNVFASRSSCVFVYATDADMFTQIHISTLLCVSCRLLEPSFSDNLNIQYKLTVTIEALGNVQVFRLGDVQVFRLGAIFACAVCRAKSSNTLLLRLSGTLPVCRGRLLEPSFSDYIHIWI